MDLKTLGWNSFFQNSLRKSSEGKIIGRICARHKNSYDVLTEDGEFVGKISGRMHHLKEYPAVGDWVLSCPRGEEKLTIEEILPRKTKISRKRPGKRDDEQIIIANVDIVFIVTSLNRDFNLKRLERYLALVNESGALPVIVLNKSDLCKDYSEKRDQVEKIAGTSPVHIISAKEGAGMSDLQGYLKEGKTVALLGSSGVGKSTIINSLLGRDEIKISDIRESDDRGRHTTTRRELHLLGNGGLIIDNPGMRELQLIQVGDGLKQTFSDIEEIAKNCKFNDCRHLSEPGCAVKQALDSGVLTQEHLDNYNKLKKEMRYTHLKGSLSSARVVEKAKWDTIIDESSMKDKMDHREWSKLKRKIKSSL